MSVTLQEAIKLILEKRKAEVERHLRKFEEEPELEVLNGRYGPYIAYKAIITACRRLGRTGQRADS